MSEFLPKRLRELRERERLSQTAVANDLGVAKNLVSTWENGKHLPTADKLPRLAGILKTSIDYLFGLTDNPDASRPQSPDSQAHPVVGAIRDSSKTLRRLLALLEDSEQDLLQAPQPAAGRRVPFYGSLSAVISEEPAAVAEESAVVPLHWLKSADDGFVTRVNGHSMSPILEHSDLVAVRRQDAAQVGDIVVAQVDGDVVIRRWDKLKGGVVLRPEDASYPGIAWQDGSRIIGKVVGLLRDVKRNRGT